MRQPALLISEAIETPATYERDAIQGWLRSSRVDPRSRARVGDDGRLVPNLELHRAIEDFCAMHARQAAAAARGGSGGGCGAGGGVAGAAGVAGSIVEAVGVGALGADAAAAVGGGGGGAGGGAGAHQGLFAGPQATAAAQAPAVKAFEALASSLNTTAAALLTNTTLLSSVLRYHVVSGRHYSSDLSDAEQLPTLLGSNVTISKPPAMFNPNPVPPAPPAAEVVIRDISAGQSVIHIINRVLTP
ncbi:hypothetical protein MNEG_13496 [Monoraphidium neglectum]|uniref:FAS1 domain-containing protein n=1 Tax=Monoraphidium neglectum TaxID=145388 RepID=A0A0D2MHE0_9CHLO|nr:hypothetical protein MNEG_13496 [Monoraphidium neglectum]KIY94465.1 hypothetical protein MNEG_13496 [Monoraphidium neglectum]|eukprot:XP_013893485.1 hypothetical protein MNEG_13496 [Monoraphidium neglectum]